MKSLRLLIRDLVWKLDRPGGRRLIEIALPRLAPRTDNRLRFLKYDDAWVHYFGENILVEPKPRLRAPELSAARNSQFYNSLYWPRTGDVVVDVGAGLGWEVLGWAGLIGPSGRLLAIEANPRIASMLRRTVDLNGLGQVIVENLAVSDRVGEVEISDDLTDHILNSIADTGEGRKVTVQAAPLDELCARHGIERIDFLKMNIEGAERLALSGLKELLPTLKVVCICCHDFLYRQTGNTFFRSKDEVRAFFVARGFVIVDRVEGRPEIVDQVNAYNPELISSGELV